MTSKMGDGVVFKIWMWPFQNSDGANVKYGAITSFHTTKGSPLCLSRLIKFMEVSICFLLT